MFEYKTLSFYNDYFSSLSDFKLSQEFVKKDDEEKKLYIGKILI